MPTQKRPAITELGDVVYESVTCDFCDQEVIKEDAQRYVVGTLVSHKDWGILGKEEYEFKRDDHHVGWVCPYCYDENGLIGLKVGPRYTIRLDSTSGMVGLCIALAVLFTLAVAL